MVPGGQRGGGYVLSVPAQVVVRISLKTWLDILGQSLQPDLLPWFSSIPISKRVLPVFKNPRFMRGHSGWKEQYRTLPESPEQAWLGKEGLRGGVPEILGSGLIVGPQTDTSPPKEGFSVCYQSGHTCPHLQEITQGTSK